MGLLSGQLHYEKWKKGLPLTRQQSILANCYMCNGFEESYEDCGCEDTCPLYQYSIYKKRQSDK